MSDLCDVTNNTQYIFSKGHKQQFSNQMIYETCYGIQLTNNLLYGSVWRAIENGNLAPRYGY